MKALILQTYELRGRCLFYCLEKPVLTAFFSYLPLLGMQVPVSFFTRMTGEISALITFFDYLLHLYQ